MTTTTHTTQQILGTMLGAALAPAAFVGSAMRHARLFHPVGDVCRVYVRPYPGTAFEDLAERLAGEGLARLSSSFGRGGLEALEPLGFAMRVHGSEGQQDLLFATFKHVWSLPVAPFTTIGSDYFANTYYAVTPFTVDDGGEVEFRLVPTTPGIASGDDRRARLAARIRANSANFDLQIRRRQDGDEAWQPLALVAVLAIVEAGETGKPGDVELHFNVANAGAGIRPSGVLNALRGVVYHFSQSGRERRGEADGRVGRRS